MHLDPRRLLVLRAVAEAGGVAVAGQRLHLAPSGISQHLAALERESGLVLVDRSRSGGQRRLQLTAAGRRLVEHADRLAAVLAAAEADALALAGAPSGPVVLAAFPTAIAGLVVPALALLAAAHPGVEPGVVELDEAPAMEALHAGEVDVVLVESDVGSPPPVRGGCASTELAIDPYRLAVPAAWSPPRAVTDLEGRAWIDGAAGSPVARVLSRLRAQTGSALTGVHRCQEFPAALSLVAAGAGAALVPDLALAEGVRAAVRVVDLPGLGARRISAVTASRARDRPVVVALRDALLGSGHRRR